jgi:predicted kinase
VKAFAEKNDYVYICPDDIRTELTGDPSDQSKNKEVWETTEQRVVEAIHSGSTVVVDATFAHHGQRKSFLEFLRNNGAQKIEGLYVNTPLEIAKERNANRERQVPEHALERMSGFMEENKPEIHDGFDALFTLDENQNLKSVEIKHNDGEISRKEFSIKMK